MPMILLFSSNETGCCISVTFISSIVWEKYGCGTGSVAPYCLHFSTYTEEQSLAIMALDHPHELKGRLFVLSRLLSMFLEVFQPFGRILLSFIYKPCRDLNELRHLSLLLFNKYMEPVRRGFAVSLCFNHCLQVRPRRIISSFSSSWCIHI
jgi:origin recognition complex subunit 5